MGDQVRELLNWARQRKILAAAFVGFTLVVGILIGSVVSGRVSATKGFGFPGTTATTLTVPDPIPATNTFAGIVNKVEPAVVNIATTQVLERRQARKRRDRKSTRLNSSHGYISYAVFCLKKKNTDSAQMSL